jgi:hypothetical protein
MADLRGEGEQSFEGDFGVHDKSCFNIAIRFVED